MFFTRLRRQAKWVFVLLVLVFGGGFVFLGVGSGGLDLGQLIQDSFGRGRSSGGSVEQARKDVVAHPRSAEAYRKLADVLESKGRVGEAITSLEQYAALQPKDTTVLERLARLQLGEADTALRRAQVAYSAQQAASAGSNFGPSSGKLSKVLGQDPISTAVTTKLSGELQQATTEYQTLAGRAIGSYKQLVKLKPNDEQAVFSLAQAAETFNDKATAATAYKKLLTLVDDSATKARIRERIKALKVPAAG